MTDDSTLISMHGSRACTRRHALKVFASTAGGILLGGRLRAGRAELPWGEQPCARLLEAAGMPLSAGSGQPYEDEARQADPVLALSPDGGRLWTAWSSLRDGAERVLLRSFSIGDQAWEPAVVASGREPSAAGPAHQPDVAFVGQRLLVVWSQYAPPGWSVFVCSWDPVSGTAGPVYRVAGPDGTAGIHWKPILAAGADRALVVWQGKTHPERAFTVFGQFVGPDGKVLGDRLELSAGAGKDCCRPAVAADPSRQGFAVAYDQQDAPGTQNVYLRLLHGPQSEWTESLLVSRHPASDLAPALAYDPTGGLLWIAWHSNRAGDEGWDLSRAYRLSALRLTDRTWHQPVGQPPACEPDPRGTVQGCELTRLCVSPSGVVCVLGRASHNFCLQYYSGDSEAPLYRLPEDGWGGRGRMLRGVFEPGGRALWVARRDLGANVLTRIDGFDSEMPAPALRSDPEPSRALRVALTGITPRYAWPETVSSGSRARGTLSDERDRLSLYFGDMHGHSWQSDGMGDPEESFLRARDVFRDDFHVLTDHDRFAGKRMPDAQWQEQKDIADHYLAPGRFITLYGQEWTTPRIGLLHGHGHFNVYSADAATPLFDHGDPVCRDLENLYGLLRRHQAIAIPHHLGWTGVPWNKLDPELTPVVEICSVHGAFEYEGNEPIRHRGGIRGCFVRDGLAAGLRFGIVGGSDQHGLTWHHGVCWKRNAYRAGLTGVWAAELKRDALLQAIRSRRTFATTGVKLCLRFTINDAMMGSTVTCDGPPTLEVDVAVPKEEGKLAWLQIVRGGAVVHQYGGEGQRSRCSLVDSDCPAGSTSYYYLRVTLENGNMAWSSPIWVTRA